MEFYDDHHHPLDIIDTEIKCPNCNTNFTWDWYQKFVNNIKLLRNQSFEDKKDETKIYEEIFDVFFNKSIKYVCDIHIIRNNMAIEILNTVIEYGKSIHVIIRTIYKFKYFSKLILFFFIIF